MADKARVTSIDALEDFRAALLRYQQRARQALDEVSGELKRTRDWLAFERRTHWEGRVRKATRLLEQAKAEMMTARFSDLSADQSAQKLAVRKAQRMLEESEEGLRRTKRWIRDFDSLVEPAGRQLDSLRERVAVKFPKAVASMDRTINSLKDYAELHPAAEEKRREEDS